MPYSKYSIYCITEGLTVYSGWVTSEITQCPNNPAHNVRSNSVALVGSEGSKENKFATTDPGVTDDIDAGYGTGSEWTNQNTGKTYRCGSCVPGAAVWVELRQDAFGTRFSCGESLGLSSSNSTNWQNKITLSLGTIPAGVYLIGFYYETTCSKGNYDGYGRVIIDDTTVIHENIFMPWNNNTGILPWSGLIDVTLTAASHHIDLEYKSSSSQNTVGIQRAHISFWRVS